MEENKVIDVDLHGQSTTSLLIGYVLVLAAIFVAFEWTQREVQIEETEEVIYDFAMEEDMIPITEQKEQVSAPPPSAPPVAELINIVDNNTEIPEEEVQTSEEVNQAITAVVGTGAPTAVVAGPPVVVAEVVEDDAIVDVPEQNASFPGGEEALRKWLAQNLKYPSVLQEQGVQGRVTCKFVVNKDGTIQDITIMRSPDQLFSDEAIRVIKKMPKWTPARQGNRAVRARFILPITFTLS